MSRHVTRKIRDPLYTTFQKIFTIIRIFLKSEAPKALYSSHSFIVSALIMRAGGGDCFGRLIARWSSFMHVSVYLEAEPPCQFPVFQTTHFGALALVRLLFHELLGLQLRRLLRWSSIGAREGFYLLCSLLLEPWIKLKHLCAT